MGDIKTVAAKRLDSCQADAVNTFIDMSASLCICVLEAESGVPDEKTDNSCINESITNACQSKPYGYLHLDKKRKRKENTKSLLLTVCRSNLHSFQPDEQRLVRNFVRVGISLTQLINTIRTPGQYQDN